MRNTLLAVTAGLFLVSFVGCKNETTPPEKTTEEKIIGKWMGVEVYYEETEPGKPVYSETEDISAYNFEFFSDGTFTMDSAGFDPETYDWAITSDGKFVWYWNSTGSDVLNIPVLNDSQFHLEEKGEFDNGSGVLIPYKDVIRLKK